MDRKSISTLIQSFDKKFLEAFSKQQNFEIKYKPSKQEVFITVVFKIDVQQSLEEIMEKLRRWDGEFRKTFKPYTLYFDMKNKQICLSYNFFQSYLKMEKENMITEEYIQIVKDALTKIKDQVY
jgi:hypothetical protein